MKKQIIKDEDNRRVAERELAILQEMEHENILKYKDSFWHDSKLYLVTELCRDGDLNNYIKPFKESNELIPQYNVLKLFR